MHAGISVAFRHRRHQQQSDEHSQAAHGFGEFLVVDGLLQVNVAAQLMAAGNFAGILGRGQHDDRKFMQVLIGFDLAQHFDAVNLGHADIQEDKVGLPLFHERPGTALEEKVEDRLAVPEVFNPIFEPAFLQAVAHEERMPLVYATADLMVCRAGAMTVAELAVAGVPAVLVPLPGAPGDHQTANARVLERVGAAVLLPDAACTPTGLGKVVEELLADPDHLVAMGRAAKGVGRPDAALAGARLVEANARPQGAS